MRALLALLLLSSCDIPKTQDIVDQAGAECQKIADEEVANAYAQCTAYYEDTVLPAIKQEIVDAERQALLALKCTQLSAEPAPLGTWDCRSTEICTSAITP